MEYLQVHSVGYNMNSAFASQIVLTDLQLSETLILRQSHTDCLSALWTDIAVIYVQALKGFVACEELRNRFSALEPNVVSKLTSFGHTQVKVFEGLV